MLKKLDQLQKHYHWFAYFYAVISCLSFIGMQLSMKVLNNSMNPFYVFCMRGIFLIIINTFVLNADSRSLNQKNPQTFKILIIRSFLLAVNFLCLFCPLKYNSISLTNCLYNLSPIIVHFLQAWSFNKPINKAHLILTIVSFIGIILIIKPQFLFGKDEDSNITIYLIFPLIAAFVYAFANVLMYGLKGKVHSMVVTHHFYICQVFIGGLILNYTPFQLERPELSPMILFSFFGLVLCSYMTQNCLARALLLKKPSFIMPINYITIILGLFIDILLFGEQFSVISVAGMVLTSSGLLIKFIIKEQ